jgi:hypothetical protein
VGADAKLMALFAALHLIGMALAAGLLVMFMRSDNATVWRPPEDEGGGGGGGSDRLPPCRPSGPDGGGLPLPDALPARVRLRDGGRLADLMPRPDRRPAHAPGRAPTAPQVPAGDG